MAPGTACGTADQAGEERSFSRGSGRLLLAYVLFAVTWRSAIAFLPSFHRAAAGGVIAVIGW